MTAKATEPLIFELSQPGRRGCSLPENDVPAAELPDDMLRDPRSTLCVTMSGSASSTTPWTLASTRLARAP